jgi:hypothetical protein
MMSACGSNSPGPDPGFSLAGFGVLSLQSFARARACEARGS